MKLQSVLAETDLILIGLGEAFQETFSGLEIGKELKNTIFEEFARMQYLDNQRKGKIDHAYDILAELLKNKNYFLVTLCNDDRIYRAALDRERIVAPCGSYHTLQCEEVCTEEIYQAEIYLPEIKRKEEPCCPHCGKKLVMNHIGVSKYSEEGYLAQWNSYTNWLQSSLNKRIIVLELGVGVKYPSVFRWPAERIVFLNQKAKLIRVNADLPYLPEEIRDKGYSIQEDPVIFLLNQIV